MPKRGDVRTTVADASTDTEEEQVENLHTHTSRMLHVS